ncbi:MAG: aldehyde dehydrogenase (NADP(+)) [Pseudomonadota bacterium]|nr:aldehyde dehydrogenase (NADP(+)) [Pseudomonadota bacterium]
MNLQGTSLIAGERGKTGVNSFKAANPADGSTLEPAFHEATTEEAARAMDTAAAAFDDYRRRPAEERAKFLERVADAIEGLGDALIERAVAETGLPTARLVGERGRTCGQLRLFAQVVREGSWVDARIDTALPDRQPLPRPDIRRMLVPLGPVVVFGSSNFPLAFSTAGGDTASALAAGCSVVVKAHRAHPGTAELVAGAITRAVADSGLPAGVFSLVHGGGSTVGTAMVRHPAAAAVGFTGSHTAGRALFNAAAARPHPIPVFAEMSSINPTFLLPDAMRTRGEAIAQGLFASFTMGVGQFCTKPGLVFALKGKEADSLIATLSKLVSEGPAGTMLTGDIRRAFEENRKRVVSAAGVKTVAQSSAPVGGAGAQAQPSVAVTDAARFLANPELATEAFGPFTLVVLADDIAQMVACTRALEGQLTATLQATEADLAAAGELLDAAGRVAGRVIINGFPTGVEVCHAMNHGGPYPATTDARFTSVGTAAILRFARPVCYQGYTDAQLPPELRNANPRNIQRLLNGELTRKAV